MNAKERAIAMENESKAKNELLESLQTEVQGLQQSEQELKTKADQLQAEINLINQLREGPDSVDQNQL